MTEDEMVGWHHWLNGHEFEQALGDCEGQGNLGSCSSWGCKESDTTEQLNTTTVAHQCFCHGIFQARILEWVAISFSRGSSWSRDLTHVSSLAGRLLTTEPPEEAPSLPKPCQPSILSCLFLSSGPNPPHLWGSSLSPCLYFPFHFPKFRGPWTLPWKHQEKIGNSYNFNFAVVLFVQSLNHVQLFATPWTAAHQASLSITISWSLLWSMSIEPMIPYNHFILCCPLLLPPSVFPSIGVFSNELALHIRWPKYWSFSISISPSSEYSGLISFRMDWLDLLVVQGTLKSLLTPVQKHQCSAFFMVQLSHSYLTMGKKHSFD